METYERIRLLRKDLKLSQDKFGERLGVSRSVIANIEANVLARPEQKEPLLRLICETFNVSYVWLTTGQGDMRGGNAEYFIKQIASKFDLDETDIEIICTYLDTPLPYRSICRDAFKLIVNDNYGAYLKDQKKSPSQRLDYLADEDCPKVNPRRGGDKVVETFFPDNEEQDRSSLHAMLDEQIAKEKKQDSKVSSVKESDAG